MNIKQDILDWVTNFIEVNHEFYNFRFPPCPYAKAARLAGLLNITVHEEGTLASYVDRNIQAIIADGKYTVTVLVLQPRARYYFWLMWWLKYKNRSLVAHDLYAQLGTARVNEKEYTVIIINRLDDIISGHRALSKTDYYRNWTAEHYNAVVTRRGDVMTRHGKSE
jgi:hypothetical protein